MKQLIVIADMEGASGIFDSNKEACWHEELYPQGTLWRSHGRACITSDVLAVCSAALDAGIEEILLYDMHYSGCRESNVMLEALPPQVRAFDLEDRCMDWGRLRGQAAAHPWGIVTVGQHARNGEPHAYLAHTIHTPPIESFWINGIHVAEIGESVLCFSGVPYIANVGCAASHKEALELCPAVSCITVKDKKNGWEPSPEETYPIIYDGVRKAMEDSPRKVAYPEQERYACKLCLTDGYHFEGPENFPWKGSFSGTCAAWEAHDSQTALSLFWRVHDYVKSDKES